MKYEGPPGGGGAWGGMGGHGVDCVGIHISLKCQATKQLELPLKIYNVINVMVPWRFRFQILLKFQGARGGGWGGGSCLGC